MRDGREGALVACEPAAEVLGKPRDALDVEVVGGLVEHEHIPVADQQRRQLRAPALATREVADARVPVEIADEARDDVANARVRSPFVLWPVSDDRLGDGAVVVEAVALIEHADGDAAAPRDATAHGFGCSGEQAQQRRLAVAVATDYANAVAVFETERDLVEDNLIGVFEVHLFGAEEMSHCSTRLVVRRHSRGIGAAAEQEHGCSQHDPAPQDTPRGRRVRRCCQSVCRPKTSAETG